MPEDPLDSTAPGWRLHGSRPRQSGPSLVPQFRMPPGQNWTLSGMAETQFSMPLGQNWTLSGMAETAAVAAVPSPDASFAASAPMSATASSDADYRTPELIALAAGLKNDVDLIFKPAASAISSGVR